MNLVQSPFAAGQDAALTTDTAGSRQSQSREIAETQVKYLMAERFPRNERDAMDRILNAFSRPTLAEKAAYQFARGGTDINGPSIRAAEAMAQQWGNIETGWRELQRGIGTDGRPFSEVEAFCTDLQARNTKRLTFIVPHWRDTRQGGYKLKDERDIYELCANQAQRRLRACILASIPGDVTESAMQQAELTLRTTADASPEAMVKMLEAFAPFGVTKEHIEKRIQRRLTAITPAQVVLLKRIYTSLRDEMSTPDEWFEISGSTGTSEHADVRGTSELPDYPDDLFQKNLPGWRDLIQGGRKTAADVVTMVSTKGKLTEAQQKSLLDCANPATAPAVEAEVVTSAAGTNGVQS